jgi:hypothetical protein
VLPEEIDSAGDSDRPNADGAAFGLAGGRIEPRFVGCGLGGITMMNVGVSCTSNRLASRTLCRRFKVLNY